MRKEKVEKNQGDFYKHIAKKYPEEIKKLGSKWQPGKWNGRYTYFSDRDWGWREFLAVLPLSLKNMIENEIFEFITKEFNPEELLANLQKTVNNYWNKIVVTKTINEDEEEKFRNLMNGIKALSIFNKHGKIRISKNRIGERLESIRAENFDITEMVPNFPGIPKKMIGANVYRTNGNCWWELQFLGISNKDEFFYFKNDNPEKVSEMKCTVKDGVFMAIPSNLMDKALTAKFTKLISDDSNGKRSLPKGKKRIHSEDLDSMDMDELDNIVKGYKLNNIIINDYDEDDEDNYRDDIAQEMKNRGYFIEEEENNN